MRFIISVIFACIIAACNNRETLSSDEKNDIENQVRQVLHDYYSDISTQGLLAEFDYLDSSENFFWVPPGYSGALPYDSVAAVLRKNAPALRSVENTFDTLRLIPLTKKLVTYTARIHSVVTDTQQHIIVTDLVETGMMIKRPGGWKLLNGQTAVLSPPGDTENEP